MLRSVFFTAVISLGIFACQSSPPETPARAMEEIIRLYENRDFDSLIRTRYAEIHKAENDAQVQSLIDKFKTRFSSDDMLEMAISTYKTALQITPQIQDDGTTAIYNLEKGFIKLTRMENGNWGFNL